jgi:hypothetical protein
VEKHLSTPSRLSYTGVALTMAGCFQSERWVGMFKGDEDDVLDEVRSGG